MKTIQKILGAIGLAAVLNGCGDNLDHFTFSGRITSVSESGNSLNVELTNANTGYRAKAVMEKANVPESLYSKLEPGRNLWLQDCEMTLENGKYVLKNCSFYR